MTFVSTSAKGSGSVGPETKIQGASLSVDGGINITSIPGSYGALRLMLMLRSDRANQAEQAGLQFNGDTGANYASGIIASSGATAFAGGGVGATSAGIGDVIGDSAPAGYFAPVQVWIFNYGDATRPKQFIHTTGRWMGVSAIGSNNNELGTGTWSGAAAVNRITAIPTAGGVNWKSGSWWALYGITTF